MTLTGQLQALVIQHGVWEQHISYEGEQTTNKHSSMDEVQSKIVDIRQGADETLGRWPTRLLLHRPSTHIDLFDIFLLYFNAFIYWRSENDTPEKDCLRNQALRI